MSNFLSAILFISLMTLSSGRLDNAKRDEFIRELREVSRLAAEEQKNGKEPCVGGNRCCHSGNKCGFGEGDCDGSGASGCVGYPSLVCGKNNCRDMLGDGSNKGLSHSDFDDTDDCCTLRPELLEFAVQYGFMNV